MKHVKIRVSGKVQGVFFRLSTKKKASKLGVNAIVRNESDGSVYIEAEGPEAALLKFIEWCKSGPPLSRVEQTIVEDGELQGFKNFEIQ